MRLDRFLTGWLRGWGVALSVVALAAILGVPAARGCPPMLQQVVGVVGAVVHEPAGDTRPGTADLPGVILELQGPAGLLRFRLSRNIGMSLAELRTRGRDGRSVRVQYEIDYDGRLRALEITGAEEGQ